MIEFDGVLQGGYSQGQAIVTQVGLGGFTEQVEVGPSPTHFKLTYISPSNQNATALSFVISGSLGGGIGLYHGSILSAITVKEFRSSVFEDGFEDQN